MQLVASDNQCGVALTGHDLCLDLLRDLEGQAAPASVSFSPRSKAPQF